MESRDEKQVGLNICSIIDLRNTDEIISAYKDRTYVGAIALYSFFRIVLDTATSLKMSAKKNNFYARSFDSIVRDLHYAPESTATYFTNNLYQSTSLPQQQSSSGRLGRAGKNCLSPSNIEVCVSLYLYLSMSMSPSASASVSVFVFVSVYVYVYVCICVYICLFVYAFICFYVAVCTCICVRVCVCICICLCLCLYLCLCLCLCLCLSLFVPMSVSVSLSVYSSNVHLCFFSLRIFITKMFPQYYFINSISFISY